MVWCVRSVCDGVVCEECVGDGVRNVSVCSV